MDLPAIGPVAGDVAILFTVLAQDAVPPVRFGAPNAVIVGEDEARLLALLDAGLAGRPDRVRRLAAAMVPDTAVAPLAIAVGCVAAFLCDACFVEHDR